MRKPEAIQVMPILRRHKLTDDRISTSVRLPRRLYMYAKDNLDVPRTIETMLRAALRTCNIDVTRPHDKEIWSPPDPLDPTGKPITWGEARRQKLVDETDKADPGGVAPEVEEAGDE